MSTINERMREVRRGLDKKMSQEAFAKAIGLSRGEIGNIEYGITQPKDFTIKQVCEKFNVNELWLRTGEGDMFREMSRDEEISQFIGDVLSGEDESFRKRFIAALSHLTADEWAVLEKVALDIAGNEKEG